MLDKQRRHFIKESIIILVVFWLISFLVIFYRYTSGIENQLNLQVELMKSQSELLTRTVKGEISAAIGDLVWYATNKSIGGAKISDVSSLSESSMIELLQHKTKYSRLVIYDMDFNVVVGADNETRTVIVSESDDHMKPKDISDILMDSDEKLVLIEYSEDGNVELSTLNDSETRIIHIHVELQNYHDLKESIEKQFGYHVGLTSENGSLWRNMGDPDIEPCKHLDCDGSEGDGFEEVDVIRRENSIAVWSCLACGKEMPYGVDRIIWINETGTPENSIIALSSLSGQPFMDISIQRYNEMKNIVIMVLIIQFLAAIIIAYVYQKYHESQMELKNQATRDGLTGFLNRFAGFEVLRNDMALAEREKLPLTVAFIDIDGLKEVNDKYGHDDGDLLIQTISISLGKYVREADSLVRIGGDEFVLILPNCEIKKANDILSRSLAWLENYNAESKSEWTANFSYGLAKYVPESGMTADEIVQMADQKMYLHKKSKKE